MRVIVLLWLSCFITGAEAKDQFIQVGCKIFSEEGKLVRDFKFEACHFFEDGSFVRANRQKRFIEKLDQNSLPLWRVENQITHHQTIVTKDQKHILFLGKSTKDYFGVRVCFDKVISINSKDGSIEKTFDFSNVFQELIVPNSTVFVFDFFEYTMCNNRLVFGHANSIFEIPKNNLLHEAFKEGNFLVVTGYENVLIVLDRNLEKILWKRRLPTEKLGIMYHDVQLSSSGEVSIFANFYKNTPEDVVRSSVLTFNPLDENLVFKEKSLLNHGKSFVQEITGGFDLRSDGSYLASIYGHVEGFQLAKFDKFNKEVLRFSPYEDSRKFGNCFQDGKYVDVKKFLMRNMLDF